MLNPQGNLEIQVCNLKKVEMLLSPVLFIYTLKKKNVFYADRKSPVFRRA